MLSPSALTPLGSTRSTSRKELQLGAAKDEDFDHWESTKGCPFGRKSGWING